MRFHLWRPSKFALSTTLDLALPRPKNANIKLKRHLANCCLGPAQFEQALARKHSKSDLLNAFLFALIPDPKNITVVSSPFASRYKPFLFFQSPWLQLYPPSELCWPSVESSPSSFWKMPSKQPLLVVPIPIHFEKEYWGQKHSRDNKENEVEPKRRRWSSWVNTHREVGSIKDTLESTRRFFFSWKWSLGLQEHLIDNLIIP